MRAPEKLMAHQTFSNFLHNINAQKTKAMELMQKAGIKMDDSSYGIPHIKQIQEFWVKIGILF